MFAVIRVVLTAFVAITIPSRAVLAEQGTGQHCYLRDYSIHHMAAHPEQTVRRMSVLIIPELQSNGAPFAFVVGARLRGQQEDMYAFGTCAWGGVGMLACAAECAAGGFSMKTSRPGEAMLYLARPQGHNFLQFNSTCGAEPGAVDLKPGLDDRLFALKERSTDDCADLMAARKSPSQDPSVGSVINQIAESTWAIDARQNCDVPAKTYKIARTETGITWTDGNGNADDERITSDVGRTFEAITEASHHFGGAGEHQGVAWKYVQTRDDQIVVFKNGKRVFDLVSCYGR